MSVKKLLVIGMDGATWDVMGPWMDAGLLPNLAALRSRGAHGALASTIQPVSAPAWVSFLTGMQQGKHGIFDFVRRKAGSYNLELTNTTMIGMPTLYEYVGQAGMSVAAINVPFTYPVWPINGVMIGGPFAPSVGPSIIHPSSLWPEIAAAAPGYEIFPDYDSYARDPQAKLLEDLRAAESNRTKAAEFLLKRQDWDAFMIVYTGTDTVQHAFWHCLPQELEQEPSAERRKSQSAYRDAVQSVYQEIDAGIGRLLPYATDDTLIVLLSDHGAGRMRWWVHLNRWLADHGYLAFRKQDRTTGKLMQAYSRLVPQPIRRTIRLAMGQRFWTLKEQLETSALASAIDWSRTRAYALGSGDIYVNLKGREPEGIVNAGPEYQALRDEIAAGLESLTSPEGRRVIARAYRREELYHGASVLLSPDITVAMADYSYSPNARFAPPPMVFQDAMKWQQDARPLTGGHRPEGVVILGGKGVRAGVQLQGARLIDLTPTMLAATGLPVPVEMDGRVLAEAFETPPAQITVEGQLAAVQRGEFSGYTASEEAKVEQRLSDLGYL